ncbi:MAG TPA: RNA methyltransferase [Burkholderiaceae bacterium]|nr:RNA methyltransferase [Burkholderiaceae bacterium]
MHRPAPAWFERLAFVLVRPSHPGNVGAVARAMRTMGLHRLVVVAPRLPRVLSHPEAIARASGALDVLREAVVADELATALAPFTHAVAVSADEREFGPMPQPPEAIARDVRAQLLGASESRVAFVFGTERNGLSIEDALFCQSMCSIPGATDYHSLNLAQAAQIVAYCLRSVDRLEPLDDSDGAARAGGARETGVSGESTLASLAAVEGLFGHLEEALVRIGFLDPAHPKKLMPRLRRLFGRTRLEVEEVALLRGVCTQILKLADGNIHGARRRQADLPDQAVQHDQG